MDEFLSTKQLGKIVGLSEATVKRWCNSGLLAFTRTPGGHRKIAVNDALAFIRDKKLSFVNPEILNLPKGVRKTKYDLDDALKRAVDYLVKGDESSFKDLLLSLYLSKESLEDIGDKVVSPAFKKIGEKWECKELEVYEERRAFEICLRSLLQILDKLKVPNKNAPTALGASLENDHYELPTLMVEITLRELGWDSKTLGSNLPVETLKVAIEKSTPSIFWISASHIEDEKEFINAINEIFNVACKSETLLIIGGEALNDKILSEIKYTLYCKNLKDLVSFIKSTKGHLVFDENSK